MSSYETISDVSHSNRPIVVGLGEALFDCFPGRTILGGAPVNVAVHAHSLLSQIGGSALPATRVGCDELGEQFRSQIEQRNLSTNGLQYDPKHPTGRVLIEVDTQGIATYNFESDVAWDNLEWTSSWDSIAERCDAVAFGTLAQRSEVSQTVIHRFLSTARNAIRLFDVNLRGNYYSASTVEQSLHFATALKLNEEEISTLCQLLELQGRVKEDVDEQAQFLCLTFGLDWLALTRGPEGSVLYQGGERYETAPVSIDEFGKQLDADTVGAGDSCCASLLTGMLLGWSPAKTLDLANRVGAYVASCPGATPRLPPEILSLVKEQTHASPT